MPTAATGRILAGRYRLISELGVGGMGVTYRAWDDDEALPVVVKMPKRESQSDGEALRRFAREIDAMLSVPHKHVVPITDHGDDNGTPYVVMRFLPGGSLADHRRRDDAGNPLPNPAGMLHFWLPAVAEALDYIHQRGLLHRDIKPGNIFFDGFRNAFLGDFGIAKVVDDSGGLAREQTLTATMMTIGTPDYMAPESFSPKATPDSRADQYALAVTVYEMLCGTRPFTGSKAHIVVEQSAMPVPPLQDKGLKLPLSLCVAVEKALAKKPSERFATCLEFVRAALRDVAPLTSEPGITRLLCPRCRNLLRLPQNAGGRTGRCPKCREPMDVAEDLGSLWLKSEERGLQRYIAKQSLSPLGEPIHQPSAGKGWRWGMLALAACCGLALLCTGRYASHRTKMQIEVKQAEIRESQSLVRAIAKAAGDKSERDRTLARRDVKTAAALTAKTPLPAGENPVSQPPVFRVETQQKSADMPRNIPPAPKDVVIVPLSEQLVEVRPLPFRQNSIGMKLIRIPAGEFVMGTPADEPGHQNNEQQVIVTISKPYWIAQTEVTQAEWKRVMNSSPWVNPATYFSERGQVIDDSQLPATFITWSAADAFCKELTHIEHRAGIIPDTVRYSLPTEAQWEYACRAGTTTRFSFGDSLSLLNEHAWWGFEAARGNCLSKPYLHAVATLKPNPWGLYDIHGNACEWCSDWHGASLPGGTDPQGLQTGTRRVQRGGHWSYDEVFCRSGDRRSGDPEERNHAFGFRIISIDESVGLANSGKQETSLGTYANSIGITLIEIPAGEFVMGSPETEPERANWENQVRVGLSTPFFIGQTEVTQGQWTAVMGTTPWKGNQHVKEDPKCAATYITWNDANTFCKKLTEAERTSAVIAESVSYSLPTEAQWEYACRAGAKTRYSFGDNVELLGEYAWWGAHFGKGNAVHEEYAHQVGRKKANQWGLYDMHGNAWELCQDWHGPALPGGMDPSGTSTGESRVLRGGSWHYNADFCRCAQRAKAGLDTTNASVGFRVVMSTKATLVASPEAPRDIAE